MTRRSSILNESGSNTCNTSTDNQGTSITETETTSDQSGSDTPLAQHLNVLQGVIAYVEVRTNNDNRSHAISYALQQLGAMVVGKFTDDVTHVIYKEGKKRTRDKASKKKIHLVSVLWVDSCRKNKEHVSEKLFPAIVPEVTDSPIQFGRLKKMKSMQPTDFATDLVGSAERCEKKRKRVATMQRFKINEEDTPNYTPPAVLVQETQPRSGPSSCESSRFMTTPMSLTIPDTPASMREKLREMKLAQLNGTEFSPLSRPGDNEPLIRKLFANEILTEEDMEDYEDEDPLPQKLSFKKDTQNCKSGDNDKTKKLRKLMTEPVKPSSFLIEPSRCSSENRPGLVPSGKKLGSRSKKKTSLDDSSITSESRTPKKKTKTRHSIASTESTPKFIPGQFDGSGSGPVRRPGRARVVQEPGSGPSSRGRKRKAQDDEVDENSNKKRCDSRDVEKVPKGQTSRRRSVLQKDSSTSAGDVTSDTTRTDTTISTMCDSDRSGVLGASMSAVFDNTAMLGLAPPRQSIDEFSSGRPRLKKIQKQTLLSIKEQKKSKATKPKAPLFQSSSASGDDEASMSDMSNVENAPKASHKLRRANSLVMEKSTSAPNTSLSSRHRPSLVMTSLHTYEQETIISVVKKLGCFLMQDNVTETTTHVVYGDPRRTLNVLAAIARGCWLLKKEWVFKSVEAGRWLDEEEFECCDKFPQAKIARQERQSVGDDYKQTLFTNCGMIFVSNKCVPPRGSLVNLIALCGGQVTSSIKRCTIHIGPDGFTGKTSVKPVWLLDCIMEQKILPLSPYELLPSNKGESSPEF